MFHFSWFLFMLHFFSDTNPTNFSPTGIAPRYFVTIMCKACSILPKKPHKYQSTLSQEFKYWYIQPKVRFLQSIRPFFEVTFHLSMQGRLKAISYLTQKRINAFVSKQESDSKFNVKFSTSKVLVGLFDNFHAISHPCFYVRR